MLVFFISVEGEVKSPEAGTARNGREENKSQDNRRLAFILS